MEIVSTFERVHQKLAEAQAQRQISDDALRGSLHSWCLSADIFGPPPSDPFSDEYKAHQLELYQQIANKPYDLSNEETVFDFDRELERPYPYGTQSASTVGSSLIGYGWLIQKMNLPAGSTILEIGSGYGPLTVHLAQMGYQVTCLDISQPLLDFVKARTGGQIETICGDMVTVPINGRFDAVIFNASLHHSLEHQSVIDRLETIVAPEGVVVFMAEPITNWWSKIVPHPWSVRLDGLSVWTMHQFGWLELGFQKGYFVKLVTAAGWHLTHYNLGHASQTDVWIASRQKRRDSRLTWHSRLQGYSFPLDTAVINITHKVANLLK